jgi:hypothetical protein
MNTAPAIIPGIGAAALAGSSDTENNQQFKKGGVIIDPRGQWAHPGKVTRIPGSDITMQGVNYPVYAKPNKGKGMMMFPGENYSFPNSDYVDEYPMMQFGGATLSGKEFIDKWIQSPMYEQMLRSSSKDNKEYDIIKKGREENFSKPVKVQPTGNIYLNNSLARLEEDRPMYNFTDEEAQKALAGSSKDREAFLLKTMIPKITGYKALINRDINPDDPMYQQSLAHEYGHREDTPWNFKDWNQEDYKQYIKGNKTLNYTPQADADKVKAALNFDPSVSEGYKKYLHADTGNIGEIRGILNEARYLGKANDIYNPYTEKITPEAFDKISNLRSGEASPIERLMKIFGSKEKAIELLNSVSKVNTNNNDMQNIMKNGGYTVTRSNDRKGKTHKVTGPGGVVKYFGDSKLGQHPKDPERKAAFYARHKKNLANNPFFRAFARKTWEDGGQTDYMQGGGLWDTDKVAYLDSTVNANKNLEFIRRAIENDGLSIPTPKGAPGYGKGMTSSHLMTYDPKSRRSYPELVNINGTLKYLTGDDAYNYAEDTGEYIQFPTAEQANYFSQNYKKSNYVKVGKQPLEKKHGIKVTYKK